MSSYTEMSEGVADAERGERLRRWLMHRYGTIAAASRETGIAAPQLSMYCSGRTPKLSIQDRLHRDGLNLNWYVAGVGGMEATVTARNQSVLDVAASLERMSGDALAMAGRLKEVA